MDTLVGMRKVNTHFPATSSQKDKGKEKGSKEESKQRCTQHHISQNKEDERINYETK